MDKALLEHLLNKLTPRRKALFEQVVAERTRFITVATQDVFQLHNTSAVIRSCDVFGIQDIHVIEEKKTKRIDREIAMGSQKWVDVHRYKTSRQCISSLKNKGYKIVATTPQEEGSLLQDFKIEQPLALFFGTEKEGLSREILEEADELLKIPMYGFTQSLNISVSAAIILQDFTSRLRELNLSWKLSELEKQKILLNWSDKSIKNSDEVKKAFHST